MKAILNRLTQHETLDRKESEGILTGIAEGTVQPQSDCLFFDRIHDAQHHSRGTRRFLEKHCKSFVWPST